MSRKRRPCVKQIQRPPTSGKWLGRARPDSSNILISTRRMLDSERRASRMGSGNADQLVYVWVGVGWKNVPSIRDLRSSSVSSCHQWHLVQRHREQMAAAVSPWQQSLVGVTHVEGFMHRFDLFNVTTYCATYSQLGRVLMISAPIPRHHAFCEMTR
jgi:hypothetical protein